MILPAIFNRHLDSSRPLPHLGECRSWHLAWNPMCAQWWVALRPKWHLEVQLEPEPTQQSALEGEKLARFTSTGTGGDVHIRCTTFGSVPETVDLTGAVHITGDAEHPDVANNGLSARPTTSASVVRLQLVTFALEWTRAGNIDQPDPAHQFDTLQPVAGTEQFRELPDHPILSHDLFDTDHNKPRRELLLLDLETKSVR